MGGSQQLGLLCQIFLERNVFGHLGKNPAMPFYCPDFYFAVGGLAQIPRFSRRPAHATNSPHDSKSLETYLRRGGHQQCSDTITTIIEKYV